MICTSIQNKGYEEILDILSSPETEMAEIRLDLCPLSDEEIEDIFANSDIPLVATCRIDVCGSAKASEKKLRIAIESGARFADLEIEAPAQMSKNFQHLCRDNGTEIIRSYHNYEETPTDEVLQMALARCFRYGADIAKIVPTCLNAEDAARIEALYSIVLEDIPSLEGRLIAFGMGEKGASTRVECLKRGAPFSYAALCEEDATAPGQLSQAAMRKAVYGDRKSYFRDSLVMPASKSFAQRAILAAALADGVSVLENYSGCGDSESAIDLVTALGATVERKGNALVITGIAAGSHDLGLDSINTGESGLLTRLCLPVLSVINGRNFTIEGTGTLLSRPLKSASDIMASFGVLVSGEKGQEKEVFIPAEVKGRLIPGTASVPGNGGSQLVSGLLMALPLCDKDSKLVVNEPKSIPYMYVTLDVLKHFGVFTRSEMEGDAALLENNDWSACSAIEFKIKGNQRYKAATFPIEGDWSAAANFLVAGAIFGSVSIEGLDAKSLQADITILDVLVEAGAVVSQVEDGELCVRKAPLEAFEQDLNNAPDLFPIVAVLAAFCAGESRISGAGRLHSKESDRAASIIEMLTRMGVEARLEGDDMFICGQSLSSRILGGRLLKGGEYTSHHDHRMVMALKVASLGADSPIHIDDEACVGKSFPNFIQML
ncbi:MAG: 3-phosphoshikimate 1-carboxyvinyltransferase [Bacteroides sp.]|nr:3-phosphoshikimate 1-carboxyvinyltransferase [Bacteroidales bacterium]MDD7490140.1 3-phosphoshikimate 1-carboxyvinyltransferase [Bacteroides sp.]